MRRTQRRFAFFAAIQLCLLATACGEALAPDKGERPPSMARSVRDDSRAATPAAISGDDSFAVPAVSARAATSNARTRRADAQQGEKSSPPANDDGPNSDGDAPDAVAISGEPFPDALADFPTGASQLKNVCGRGHDDIVSRALCKDPKIDSIVALQEALGLPFVDRNSDSNGGDGNPNISLLGHSTSLFGRHVSAINPRAFVFTPLFNRLNGYVVMAFTRGAPFVELAAQDSVTSRLSFYLLRFTPPCAERGSCTNADLLTPSIERDWQNTSLYDEEDLKNTVLDCRQCHQPGGPGANSILRMHELQLPWTHWFSNSLEGGVALLQDFQAAHGASEDYAGIPAALLPEANGFSISTLVISQGFAVQPNEFQSFLIETEVKLSAEQQPLVNTPKGTSATWQQIYDAAAAGLFVPPPYHDVKVTDPRKLAKATTSYKDVLAGRAEPDTLADLRDVFLDEALAEMNFAPAEDATGAEVLLQACSQCHNSRLDQALTRARFDATRLNEMSAEVKALAKARMSLPTTDIRHMPPVMFRSLSQSALERALDELSR